MIFNGKIGLYMCVYMSESTYIYISFSECVVMHARTQYILHTTHFMRIYFSANNDLTIEALILGDIYTPREAATATPSISMPVSVNSWKLDNVYRDIVRGDEESSREQSTRISN